MPQLDSLGLRENPFKNNTEQRYFYVDQNRAQILESTEHLIDYSSNFQVILGESGVGKSHLLDTLASRVDNNWRIAKVNNADQYDTLSLIQAILNAFGSTNGNSSELLEALETQLAEISELGFKPVLLVDSAQALSIDSLRFLIQLSQQKQNDEPYINIVLFATDAVTESLQSSELRSYRDIIHIVTLNRFDKEGMSGFLRHKMAVAGYDRESPFTPRIIDSIFDNSQGLPEKINFFANKFLASSGKTENYIVPGSENQHANNITPTQEKNENLIDSLIDDDLPENRNDRAAEQLSRLAEKFEEIEQLGEQSVDTFLSTDRDDVGTSQGSENFTSEEQYENESPDDSFDETLLNNDDESSSGLPKFIIPVAVIGILIVAIIVINSVFDSSEQADSQVAVREKIELLPLELPPQGSVLARQETIQENKTIDQSTELSSGLSLGQDSEKTEHKAEAPIVFPSVSEAAIDTAQDDMSKLEVVEVVASKAGADEPVSKLPVIQEAVIETVSAPINRPKLVRVEPEPVIGSNSRQTITVIGNNFEKEMSLMVSWADNKKEFSAQQTPDQWQYINKNKIKLQLSFGIKSQQWQIMVKTINGTQSQSIHFDVVRPFISKLAIQGITPAPFIGSDKRQAVTIMGQGFSKQTVFELKWDKNKKHFSSRLTPSQFEFVSASQIKLFIATGTKERKWRVMATNPAGNTSASSFTVVKTVKTVKKVKKDKQAKQPVSKRVVMRDEAWLMQQPDTNYTIQLFGSYNKQAIDELVKKHSLKGDILRFKTLKEGRDWFTMTYGNYASKQDATTAVASLDSSLTNPRPWVRSLGSIKVKLRSATKVQSDSKLLTTTTSSQVKDEAWVWTQNPADYTVQLIALSSKSGMDDYIKKYELQSEAVYFKTFRSNKLLYVLLYGHYSDKNEAIKAGEKLSAKITGSKPWVRRFSAVHEMMSSR